MESSETRRRQATCRMEWIQRPVQQRLIPSHHHPRHCTSLACHLLGRPDLPSGWRLPLNGIQYPAEVAEDGPGNLYNENGLTF